MGLWFYLIIVIWIDYPPYVTWKFVSLNQNWFWMCIMDFDMFCCSWGTLIFFFLFNLILSWTRIWSFWFKNWFLDSNLFQLTFCHNLYHRHLWLKGCAVFDTNTSHVHSINPIFQSFIACPVFVYVRASYVIINLTQINFCCCRTRCILRLSTYMYVACCVRACVNAL